MWNINEAFSYASVGADAGFAARVERLLKLCRPESLAAANLCEAYRRISQQWSAEKEVAESKLDGERYEVDQAKIGVQAAVAKAQKILEDAPETEVISEAQKKQVEQKLNRAQIERDEAVKRWEVAGRMLKSARITKGNGISTAD